MRGSSVHSRRAQRAGGAAGDGVVVTAVVSIHWYVQSPIIVVIRMDSSMMLYTVLRIICGAGAASSVPCQRGARPVHAHCVLLCARISV